MRLAEAWGREGTNMGQQQGTAPSNVETYDPEDVGLPLHHSRLASQDQRRHRRRLGVMGAVVRALLSMLVIILATGLVVAALAVIGTYIVHLFAPESWHWLTDQQLARLPLL